MDSTLKGIGFEESPHEAAIYRRGSGENALLVGVYVDDLVISGTKDAEMAAFKEEMKVTFQMSDLGLSLSIWESRCTRMTPGSLRWTRLKLSRDSTTEEVDATQYWRLVGSLRYLAHTRPDLGILRRLR